MKKIQDTIQELLQRYGRIATIATSNMRLILLILFGILCGYLVVRVNGLVSDKPAAVQAASDVSSMKPDSGVVSVFNELKSQNIEVSSQFDTKRNSPF